MVNLLIEGILKRIDQRYHPGCLAWIKRKRPDEWRRLISLETEINRLAFLGDEAGLNKALGEYKVSVLEMVNAFKSPTQEIGNLFQKEMR